MPRQDFNGAQSAKKDEFYTQLPDIENELKHYRKHFKGKTVFCNCDDPFESNFFKYFVLNFNRLELKKLICTCYVDSPFANQQLSLFDIIGESDEEPELGIPYKAIVTQVYDKTGDGGIDMFDVAELFKSGENKLTELNGDGDFRSQECIELLKEADIVCTNPPFSLFREYIAQLIEYKKKFIVIGNVNAITYKEFFPLIKNNEVWVGFKFNGKPMEFMVPDDYPLEGTVNGFLPNGKKYIGVGGTCWYTNLDIKKMHEELILVKKYNPEDYPKYVNYDAIDVSRTLNIPCDYDGEMGVPISFLDKYNPDQFEIIGISLELAKPMKTIAEKGTYMQGGNRFYTENLNDSDKKRGYKYHREYDRIVIKNKNPEERKKRK